jgi:hypothetical protein
MTATAVLLNDLDTLNSYGSFPPSTYVDRLISGKPILAIGYKVIRPWVSFRYPIETEMSRTYITEVSFTNSKIQFYPQTPLGKKLYSLRKEAIASGIKLLSEEEVLEEIMRRRGELVDDKEDLY